MGLGRKAGLAGVGLGRADLGEGGLDARVVGEHRADGGLDIERCRNLPVDVDVLGAGTDDDGESGRRGRELLPRGRLAT